MSCCYRLLRGRASSFSLVLCFTAYGTAVRAADWYTGQEKPSETWIVAVNSSVTVTSIGSQFADLNATVAVDGKPDESGFRVRLDGLGGVYKYRDQATGLHIHGQEEEGSLLGGYQWIGQSFRIAGFVGPDLRNDSVSIPDPHNPVIGTSVGAKAVLDGWFKPLDRVMISGYGSYTTNDNAYFTRLKAGYAVLDEIYIGPETALLGNDFFNQWRIGGHLSGLQLGPLQFALAGGYLHDRMQKGGAYTTLDIRSGF
jgi:hypothetical protein